MPIHGALQDVLVYERNKPIRVVIFSPNGKIYVFEPEQISALELK